MKHGVNSYGCCAPSACLADLEPDCGWSCVNCWRVDFLQSAALAPAHLSPPIDPVAC